MKKTLNVKKFKKKKLYGGKVKEVKQPKKIINKVSNIKFYFNLKWKFFL